jgi:ribosome biogenesis GTPase
MEPSLREGLVLRIDAKVCHVEVDGQRHLLPLRGRLFETPTREKKPIAVGDRVQVRLDGSGGAIEVVLPRESQLLRRASGEGERGQVVAANVTLVLAVASVAEPPFQPSIVDGVLAAAGRERIPAALVLTKVDLDRDGAVAKWTGLYRSLGYAVHPTSRAPGHETRDELHALALALHHNRTVLCGLSGAGKSSLLNAVIPGLQLRIGSLSHIRQGKHTTAHTELVPLPGGGHVLDTPGIRAFHQFSTGAQELQFLFPELSPLLPLCEYRNCLHADEPACAVLAALRAGTIAASRYESYRVMLAAALGTDPPGASTDDAGGGQREPPRSPRRRRR